MISRFKPMFSATADGFSGGVWIMHRSLLPDIYAFETGTGGSVWNTNIAQGPTMVLDGRPIIFSEHLAQANASGAILLAELASYILFELGGMYIDYSEHADFLNGNDVWRYGTRIDGKPWLNGQITLAGAGSAFTVSPFVYAND
jgi:HK97 family phage major capsid protein